MSEERDKVLDAAEQLKQQYIPTRRPDKTEIYTPGQPKPGWWPEWLFGKWV